MTFNLFVLQFFLGLIFLFYTMMMNNRKWIREMDPTDRKKLKDGLRSSRLSPVEVVDIAELVMEAIPK